VRGEEYGSHDQRGVAISARDSRGEFKIVGERKARPWNRIGHRCWRQLSATIGGAPWGWPL